MVVSTNITLSPSGCVIGVALPKYAAKEYLRQLQQKLITYGEFFFEEYEP